MERTRADMQSDTLMMTPAAAPVHRPSITLLRWLVENHQKIIKAKAAAKRLQPDQTYGRDQKARVMRSHRFVAGPVTTFDGGGWSPGGGAFLLLPG